MRLFTLLTLIAGIALFGLSSVGSTAATEPSKTAPVNTIGLALEPAR